MGNVADYKEPEFLKSDHCTMVFFDYNIWRN